MSALKLKACDRCASIKQVCDRDGSHSCSRCIRLELPCAITRIHKVSYPSDRLVRQSRRYGILVLENCGKPFIKGFELILHKPMGRPRKDRTSGAQGRVALSMDVERASAEDGMGCCNNALIKTSTLPPTRHRKIEVIPYPRTKRVPRTRSGCITCKQRRKKCDEANPVCGDCTRLGLVCRRTPPKPQSAGELKLYNSKYAKSAYSTLEFSLSPLWSGCTSQEALLFRHYTNVVARSLSVVPDEINAFIDLFVPMAVQQPAMRNALLGLSATHLKRHHEAFKNVALEYQAKALAQARTLVQVNNDDDAAIEGLAAILFLCVQEICEGNSDRWPYHLQAAVTIINNKGGPTKFPPSVNFLVESVAYFDSIATLSFSKCAILDQQFYVPHSPESALEAHALFGIAHTLFAIIADISQLAQVREIRSTASGELAFRNMAAELELQLQEWSPMGCSSVTEDDALEQKVIAAGVMLQWAALVRLHQIVEGNDIMAPKVRTGVANILMALETIPPADLVESMLIFPMVIAGMCAATVEEKVTVKRRFEIMEHSIGFGNVFEAHAFVESVWKKMDEGMNVQWEDAMEEEGGTLIMS